MVSRNSNVHKLSHGSPIQAHNTSRCLKLNNKCSREIQMVKQEKKIWHHKICETAELNRNSSKLPPLQNDQDEAFSLAVHDQHSDNQSCQDLQEVF